MNDWRSRAWYQIHALGQLLGAEDAEVKRRERMFTAIDTFSHAAHREGQFHQLEGCTRAEVELLKPMLEAEHVRAHVLPPEPMRAPASSEAPAPAPAAASSWDRADSGAAAPSARSAAPAARQALSRGAGPGPRQPAAQAERAPVEADDDLAFDSFDPLGQPDDLADVDDPMASVAAEIHAEPEQLARARGRDPEPRPPAPAPVREAARVGAASLPAPAPRAPAPAPAPEPEPPRPAFQFVPLKEKKKARGDSPAKLYQEAMGHWNDYLQNENKGTLDGRTRSRAAAKAVRDLVLRLGKSGDGDSQLAALLTVVGLSEEELLNGELERRLR